MIDRPAGRESLMTWVVLAAMILLFGLGFSWLSILRHEAFQSHAFDLGNMDQAAWNTIHGRPLRFTDMSVGPLVLTNRLAIHVEPMLFLVALLYLIHGGPATLLVTQAWVVAFGAVPAYLLARDALQRDRVALAFPFAYLMHPSLQNAVLDDFHPVTLAACLLLWAVYFAWSNRALPFVVAALAAAATKEDIGLLAGLLGLLFVLRGRRALGLAVLAAGAAWFWIGVSIIIPHFNPAGQSPYLLRYAYLGHGIRGVLAGAVRHPGVVLSVLTSPSRIAFIRSLLQPLGLTSLLGFPILLLDGPSWLIDMLSADPTMYSGFYQYAAEIVPYVVAASALGIAWLSRAAVRRAVPHAEVVPAVLGGLVIVAAVLAAVLDGFSPLAYGYVIPSPGPHQSLERRILAEIPGSAVVAAADEIEPHLSDRTSVYLLPTIHPENGPAAQYVVLDASVPSLPVTPHELHDTAVRALHHGYGVQSAADGVLLLRRGLSRQALPPSFYTFVFARPSHLNRRHDRWGPLSLVAATIHPGNGYLNRSRPAVGIETYWRTRTRLPPHARITFFWCQPPGGKASCPSGDWHASSDSPTWDWLPLTRWPLARQIHVVSLPLLPDISQGGMVLVAVGVRGLGPGSGPGRVAGRPDLTLLALLKIGP